MGQIYFPNDHTPQEWRDMAKQRRQSERESFERSDTDGYLSQWALGLTAQLYDTLAIVAEHGGMWEFRTLADVQGTVIEGAREVRTRYGWAWLTPSGQFFNPSHARNEADRKARDLAKGFQFVMVSRPAAVTLQGESFTSVRPVILPKRTRDE